MNIFYVDSSPARAAQALGDKHINKMIVESTQMLLNAFPRWRLATSPLRTRDGFSYRHSYPNHPCSKWVLESSDNYRWLLHHALALLDERGYRWPSAKKHHSGLALQWILEQSAIEFPKQTFTQPAQAIPLTALCRADKNFSSADVLSNYRLYYKLDKKHLHHWTTRTQPLWLD